MANLVAPGLKILGTVAPPLAPATDVLKEAWETLHLVHETREGAERLVDRAERTLKAIDPIVRKKNAESIRHELERLLAVLVEIRDLMHRLATKNYFKRLTQQDEDERDLSSAHRKITDILQLFSVAAESEIKHDLEENERARLRDHQRLEAKLAKLQANDVQLLQELRLFGAEQGQVLKAMRDMQKILATMQPRANEHRDRAFVNHTVQVLQQYSTTLPVVSAPHGRQARPQWYIPASDIEIDENAPLGRGGFGVVYVGRWQGATVAVKKLTKDASAEMISKEISVWRELRHPHVLHFYGASGISESDDEPAYIVSQYLKNGNAPSYLKKNPDTDRVKLLNEIALGMQYLHSFDIIHGDLKGVNVLITDSGQACLADFGMSEIKLHSSTAITHGDMSNLAGTPRYLSPERWKGALTRKTDVFAFAMTATEIFTDQPPFGYVNGVDLIYHLIVRENARPDRPDSETCRRLGLSDEIWAIIGRCWDKDPGLRPTFTQIAAVWPPAKSSPGFGDVASTMAQLRLTDQQPNATSSQLLDDEFPSPSSPGDLPPAYTPSAVLQGNPGASSQPQPQPQPQSYYPPEKRRVLPAPPSNEQSSHSLYPTPLQPSRSSRPLPPVAPQSLAPNVPQSLPPAVQQSLPPAVPQPLSSPPLLPQPPGSPIPPHLQQNLTPNASKRFSMGKASSTASSALLLSRALQNEMNSGKNPQAINEYIKSIVHSAVVEKEADKLVSAGAIPMVTTLMRARIWSGEAMPDILSALGLLCFDLLAANSIYRSGAAKTIIDLLGSASDNNTLSRAAWVLGRLARSDEISAGLIKDGALAPLLQSLHASTDSDTLRACLWTLGNFASSDDLANKLAEKGVIQAAASSLTQLYASENPDDVCTALYCVARLARVAKLAKALAQAGVIEPILKVLSESDEPMILNWSARAVGCLVRPNQDKMANLMLDGGAAEGLARLPRTLPPEEIEPLGSFAFAIQRFSCAEWGSGIRKKLVNAGVVDGLLQALRTVAAAGEEAEPQVIIELALAVSFLGDVGGAAIRKEIQDAGGIDILKSAGKMHGGEVAKNCDMAVQSITGGLWGRHTASIKTAMAHDWKGGCPPYPFPHPVSL